MLAKLQPRLYSISSSLKAYPDQVHFTVDVVHYESRGRQRKGVCSSFLAERAEDVPVPVFPNTSQEVSSAGGSEYAHHHGWAREPASRLFAPICRSEKPSGRKGKELALLRIAASSTAIIFTAKNWSSIKREGFLTRLRLRLVTRSGRQMATSSTRCWKTRPKFGNGWIPRARTSSFAATRGAWPRMSMPRYATIIQEQGGKSEEQTNEYVEKLKSDKRYKRDVY